MYYDWVLKWRKLYLTITQYSIWPILLTSTFITQKVSVCMVNGIKNAQRNETMLAMVEKMGSRTNVFIDVCETKFTMMILKWKAVASPYMFERNWKEI